MLLVLREDDFLFTQLYLTNSDIFMKRNDMNFIVLVFRVLDVGTISTKIDMNYYLFFFHVEFKIF